MRKILLFILLFCPILLNAQTSHVVQRGETLELIAKRHGVLEESIKETNPLIDEYYVGISLSIPSKPKKIERVVKIRKRENTNVKTAMDYSQQPHVENNPQEWNMNLFQMFYPQTVDYGNEYVRWNFQHMQLQNNANAFFNSMVQSVKYQPNISWDNYNPNIDYSTMYVPVLENSSTSINTSTSGLNGTTSQTSKLCGTCGGKGWIPETKGVASFGLSDKWCNECNENVRANHYHAPCPSCKGMW